MKNFPLVVDLDGTLIHSDMLHEMALTAATQAPLLAMRAPFMLSKGKAFLKKQLALNLEFEPSLLPYNQELLAWLKAQKLAGRSLILCTASDHIAASKIAEYLGIFDEVMASDGIQNLAGKTKADALVKRFGEAGYDYVGNSKADLPVWSHARQAIVVNAGDGLLQNAKKIASVETVFAPPPSGLKAWLRMLRVHQWLKNVLIFIPIFAAHDLSGQQQWGALILAFIAFSLCASSVYIGNDLIDLENDRRHLRKRKRPFAAATLPIWQGVFLAPLLLAVSFIIAGLIGKLFLVCLAVYFAVTCAYSLGLKRLVLIDCIVLAVLYTLRVIAGGAAVHLSPSFWLLAFSGFLFLSLSFVKRYAELELQILNKQEKLHGRGYHTTDAPLIQSMGIVAGYASAVVLSLYLNSDSVVKLYAAPQIIWGAVPVLLFWVSWMWIQAHRGKMHDDPLVYAVKDRVSLIAGLVFAAVMAIGTIGI